MLTSDSAEIKQIIAELSAATVAVENQDPWMAQTLRNRVSWWVKRAQAQAP